MIILDKNFSKYKNRGFELENIINRTIEYYKKNCICVFFKVPTPIQITKSEINEYKKAFFKEKAFLDYICLYKGKFIAIEAKKTSSDVFPLNNIKIHQFNLAEQITKNGGFVYFLIEFSTLNRYFLIEYPKLETLSQYKKSIKLEAIIQNSLELTLSKHLTLNIIDFL